MRTTQTYVDLEISAKEFAKIAETLREAGYDHCFVDGGIVPQGIRLVSKSPAAPRPRAPKWPQVGDKVFARVAVNPLASLQHMKRHVREYEVVALPDPGEDSYLVKPWGEPETYNNTENLPGPSLHPTREEAEA